MSQKRERYVTAAGIGIYPSLVDPDTKFNSKGVYQVKLRLPPDAELFTAKPRKSLGKLKEFLDRQVEQAYEHFKKKGEAKGRKKLFEPYTVEEETGDLILNFKMNASGETRDGKAFTQKPALFDEKGQVFQEEFVGNGSELKCSFELIPFYTSLLGAGLGLRLKAAQILNLVGGYGANADSFGFDEEEAEEDDNSSDFSEEDDLEEEDF